ncbi:MAG: 3',5'-cyclic-nucleotide phosphodiesterase [Deltaproteobacteria bacterium]|nr:3',5'-cyclic-nucleotide phosphodiesterase [Deltaproteobacteria bacterium]
MNIQLLGAEGGVEARHPLTTTFLINGETAIDAGSIASALSFEDQLKIQSVVITHSHWDHIRDLPFLAINRFGTLAPPVQAPPIHLYGGDQVLTALQNHLFNDLIWPDCTRRPDPSRPSLTLHPMEAGKDLSIGPLTITPIPVNHSFQAFGYIVSEKGGAGKKSGIVISGDTGPTEELWKAANQIEHLKAVFLELSFPKAHASAAIQSRHISTASLSNEIQKIKKNIPIFAYHLKPPFHEGIEKELKELGLEKRVKIAKSGDTFEF